MYIRTQPTLDHDEAEKTTLLNFKEALNYFCKGQYNCETCPLDQIREEYENCIVDGQLGRLLDYLGIK